MTTQKKGGTPVRHIIQGRSFCCVQPYSWHALYFVMTSWISNNDPVNTQPKIATQIHGRSLQNELQMVDVHGFSMDFPWMFHDFPWIFHGFSMDFPISQDNTNFIATFPRRFVSWVSHHNLRLELSCDLREVASHREGVLSATSFIDIYSELSHDYSE